MSDTCTVPVDYLWYLITLGHPLDYFYRASIYCPTTMLVNTELLKLHSTSAGMWVD